GEAEMLELNVRTPRGQSDAELLRGIGDRLVACGGIAGPAARVGILALELAQVHSLGEAQARGADRLLACELCQRERAGGRRQRPIPTEKSRAPASFSAA